MIDRLFYFRYIEFIIYISLYAYLLRSTKELLDKVIVNLTPVRVAHLSRKGAKEILDYRVNLGVFATSPKSAYFWCVRQDFDFVRKFI